ncbi:MAG: hypothetical protein LBL82_05820 [Oscillospiraceae bacterium]|nr:hypothetical protein [Oscillospiraceae bacterium]
MSKSIDDMLNSGATWDDLIKAGFSHDEIVAEVKKLLTRAQKRNIDTLENTIRDHLKESDFSGTLRDLQGNPVPNPKGGYYNHLQEMLDSYTALKDIKSGLSGSLKNSNLSPAVREYLQGNLNITNDYINKIKLLFEAYGGI